MTLKETFNYTKDKGSLVNFLDLAQTPSIVTAKSQDILAEFSDLAKPNLQPSMSKLKASHKLENEGKPMFVKPTGLEPNKLKISRVEFS